MRRPGGLLVTATLLAADVALAADSLGRQRSSPLCTCLCTLIFVAIFRAAGVTWGLSIGTSIFPVVFGWFVWREREYGIGIRVFAVVMAVLQGLGFLAGLLVALLAPAMLSRLAAQQQAKQPVVASPASPSSAADDAPEYDHEKDVLGLHPEGSVISEPAGATVFLNDKNVGKAPLRTRFNAGKPNVLRLELDGYFPARRVVEPNTNEHLDLTIPLEKGAALEVKSEPAGAVVLLDGGVVLHATPGWTRLLERDQAELVIKRDGFIAERKTIDLAAEEKLEVTLNAGVKLSLDSDPPRANVSVDGALLGVTPLDAWVDPKGKHTVVFSLEPLTPVTKTLNGVKDGARLSVKLVDQELSVAEKKVSRLKAAYEKAEAELMRLQESLERMPSRTTEKKLETAQRVMEKTANDLEAAEEQLKELKAARPPQP